MPRIFLPDARGRRQVFGGQEAFWHDPNWGTHLLLYEYFHVDSAAGLGVSHQTGWTALVANLIQRQGEQRGRETGLSQRYHRLAGRR